MYCHHGKDKKNSLDLRKRIVNAHKGGEAYTRLSKRFQVSRTAVRSIIKKFEETHSGEQKQEVKDFKNFVKETIEKGF